MAMRTEGAAKEEIQLVTDKSGPIIKDVYLVYLPT
jgi:hypothetical protein